MSDDSSHSSDDSGASWITSFCQEQQNQFFCEVERAFIEDGFNLYGLRPYVKHFKESLDIILDKKSHSEDDGEDQGEYQENAELLYGMIHARYIITMHGMETMSRKYDRKDFGQCPRIMCEGQAVVPLGTKDDPYQDLVRIFCPRCQQVYNPPAFIGSRSGSGGGGGGGRNSCGQRRQRQGSSSPSSSSSSSSSSSLIGVIRMDAAFIGTTFPHLFFMTFENKIPPPARDVYVPRVFGFKLHETNKSRVFPTLLPVPVSTPTIPAGPHPPKGADGTAAAAGGGNRGEGAAGAANKEEAYVMVGSDDTSALAHLVKHHKRKRVDGER